MNIGAQSTAIQNYHATLRAAQKRVNPPADRPEVKTEKRRVDSKELKIGKLQEAIEQAKRNSKTSAYSSTVTVKQKEQFSVGRNFDAYA